MSAQPVAEAVKELSMLKQKEMIAGNYELLATAKEKGRKVVSTFVPGNLNELLMCFDVVNNLPEINAIQNGMPSANQARSQAVRLAAKSQQPYTTGCLETV